MMVSPFTFYRGAAKIMAADLDGTPTAGLVVQLCGDAHLSNFGFYASPERTLVFDLNDYDETLPGPFEYDLARLAASFTIAGRHNGFTASDERRVAQASVRAYREAMHDFAGMRTLDIWYAHLSEQELMGALERFEASERVEHERGDKKKGKGKAKKELKKAEKRELARAKKAAEKARTRDSTQALSKLGELVDGRYRIASNPPIVIPARELVSTYGLDVDEAQKAVHTVFREYRSTLQTDRRHLLERFEVIDMARKVVGVGSVGTRAFIVLLQGRDQEAEQVLNRAWQIMQSALGKDNPAVKQVAERLAAVRARLTASDNADPR